MVDEHRFQRYPLAWSGLVSGAGAWAISTQANYALVLWQCSEHAHPISWIAFALVVTALAGGFLSLHSWRNAASDEGGLRLAAGIGTLAGFLFAAVIVLQGMAALIFTGCER